MRRVVQGQVLALLMVLPLVSGAKPLYVHSAEAVLRSEPAFDAEELATLARGEKVDGQGEEGRWYRVKAGQRQGWVLRFLLEESPPVVEEDTELGEEGPSIREDARRRASEATTAGAARGLRGKEERSRQGVSATANYTDLERLMTLEIPPEAEEAFARGDAP